MNVVYNRSKYKKIKEATMERKTYEKPCFEYIILCKEEVMANLFLSCDDNDLLWSDI